MIYFDHNATTPLAPEVLDAMSAALRDHFANASSVHTPGQRARAAVDDARARVAALVNGEPSEIVFTSGGTESDNLAVRGAAAAAEARGKRHLVVSAIEHEAVLNTARALGRQGWTVTQVPPTETGVITPDALAAALRGDTALVSVMHANNEIGTVQPVTELAAVAHARGIPFHTDAVQSAGRIPIDVQALGVDLLSISAHKFHGPKGVGALWVRRGTRLVSTQTGGRQERNRRAGTENVPGIVGFGAAAARARGRLEETATRIAALRDRLEREILARIPGTVINGGPSQRLPNTSNISFEQVEAESLLIALDLEGIAVSTGSACSSGTLEPSHVLRAMRLPAGRVQGALRFSLGEGNTESEINRVLELLPGIVERLHRVASTVK